MFSVAAGFELTDGGRTQGTHREAQTAPDNSRDGRAGGQFQFKQVFAADSQVMYAEVCVRTGLDGMC